MAAAFLLANLIALALDPAIFQHYREMLGQEQIGGLFIPALSGMIRALFFRRFFWAQFVPMGLGLLWSARYYWKNRRMWNWRQHGLALLVVSLLTTPYSWMTDEAVLLSALLQGGGGLSRARPQIPPPFLLLLFFFFDFLFFLF